MCRASSGQLLHRETGCVLCDHEPAQQQKCCRTLGVCEPSRLGLDRAYDSVHGALVLDVTLETIHCVNNAKQRSSFLQAPTIRTLHSRGHATNRTVAPCGWYLRYCKPHCCCMLRSPVLPNPVTMLRPAMPDLQRHKDSVETEKHYGDIRRFTSGRLSLNVCLHTCNLRLD